MKKYYWDLNTSKSTEIEIKSLKQAQILLKKNPGSRAHEINMEADGTIYDDHEIWPK